MLNDLVLFNVGNGFPNQNIGFFSLKLRKGNNTVVTRIKIRLAYTLRSVRDQFSYKRLVNELTFAF